MAKQIKQKRIKMKRAHHRLSSENPVKILKDFINGKTLIYTLAFQISTFMSRLL